MAKLSYIFNSGKNPKWSYYLVCITRLIIPKALCNRHLTRLLHQINSRRDADEIYRRINYCNGMTAHIDLPKNAPTLKANSYKHSTEGSSYYFDSYEFTRYFSQTFHWLPLFGDITQVPKYPSITKSRPTDIDNKNSILLNLDKNRHFVFINDKIPYLEKLDKVIFRGKILQKSSRIDFMNKFFDNPRFDCGDVSSSPYKPEWKAKKISLYAHLHYKFIMAIEGNDVASNLKWVMSSNSIAVMPKPTIETWFMEGTLIPDVHYIQVKHDFSDLEERINYFLAHPEKALEIIKNANDYVSNFQDKKREKLISIGVLQKYFIMTNQTD